MKVDLATLVSLILSPHAYSLVVVALLWIGSGYEGGIVALAAASFFASVLPFLFILTDALAGEVDVFVSEREKRLKYFLLTELSYILGLAASAVLSLSQFVTLFLVSMFVSFILLLISRWWKVSIHAAGIVTPTTLLANMLSSWFYVLYILIIPVFWSRLKMGAHSLPQLVGGVAVALLATLAACRLI